MIIALVMSVLVAAAAPETFDTLTAAENAFEEGQFDVALRKLDRMSPRPPTRLHRRAPNSRVDAASR